MKSLHTRLDPTKDEVLEVARNFGVFRAMAIFGVNDYLAFRNWLKEVTGDEDFGAHPKLSLNGNQTVGDQLVDAILRKLANLQAENERLHQELEHLKWQLSGEDGKETQQALAILQACED